MMRWSAVKIPDRRSAYQQRLHPREFSPPFVHLPRPRSHRCAASVSKVIASPSAGLAAKIGALPRKSDGSPSHLKVQGSEIMARHGLTTPPASKSDKRREGPHPTERRRADPRAGAAARRNQPHRNRGRARRTARPGRPQHQHRGGDAGRRYRMQAPAPRAGRCAGSGWQPPVADVAKHPGVGARRRWSAPLTGRQSPAPGHSSKSAPRCRSGQTLLIIEAMKTMNQIPSTARRHRDTNSGRRRPAGRIRRAAGHH